MTDIILVQLGSPRSVRIADVRAYLREFLSHRQVVDLSPFIWKPILYFFILPFYARKSARAYRSIWQEDGSPLIKLSEKLSQRVQEVVRGREVKLNYLLSSPRLDSAGPNVFLISLFPQYCRSTTGLIPINYRSRLLIETLYREDCYINGSVRMIDKYLEQLDGLIISFHGVPLKQIEDSDPYYLQCLQSFALIREKLNKNKAVYLAFQSRFGHGEWTGPALAEVAFDLIAKGKRCIGVYCASFLVDCLETLEEVGNQLRRQVRQRGGELVLIPCLNDDLLWAQQLGNLIEEQCQAAEGLAR